MNACASSSAPKVAEDDVANKKKFSQIGPAIPELLWDRQTDKNPYYFVVLIMQQIKCSDYIVTQDKIETNIRRDIMIPTC